MAIVLDFPELMKESGDLSYLRLAGEIVLSSPEENFLAVLDGVHPEKVAELKQSFAEFGTNINVVLWYFPIDFAEDHPFRLEVAGWLKSAFIASLNPQFVLTTDSRRAESDVHLTASHSKPETLVPSFLITAVSQTAGSSSEPSSFTFSSSDLWQGVFTFAHGSSDKTFGGTDDDISRIGPEGLVEIARASANVSHESEGSIYARKRLAYVSPLPPVQSGIADYSLILVEELKKYYDIEIYIKQTDVSVEVESLEVPILDYSKLDERAATFDRIVYNFGNSPFHDHMTPLLRRWPGVVDLHDFYLSDLRLATSYANPGGSYDFHDELYFANGYPAVGLIASGTPVEELVRSFPANREILERAIGVIAHSDYSKGLATTWYGDNASEEWACVPLPRKRHDMMDRARARRELGLSPEDFVVCSFGFVSQNKLSDRLVDAWLASELASSSRCRLILVGGISTSPFGEALKQRLDGLDANTGVTLTGWCEPKTYDAYLAAADIAVQLRTASRGETSAAVLDCMSAGLPLIVNANGSAASLPVCAVELLPDAFTTHELTEALERLYRDVDLRIRYSAASKAYIERHHQVGPCAELYHQAVEHFYRPTKMALRLLLDKVANNQWGNIPKRDYELLAKGIAATFPGGVRQKTIFIDVSAICRNDIHTGIQRVVRALVAVWLRDPPAGWRIEPVYVSPATGKWHYHHARRWTYHQLGLPFADIQDEIVDFKRGDVLLILDFTGPMLYEVEEEEKLYTIVRNSGVFISTVIYDILPIKFPKLFPFTAAAHDRWLKVLGQISDQALCISHAVADDVAAWFEKTGNRSPAVIEYFHLGADISNSKPTVGLPDDFDGILSNLATRPSFLMVGTLEPRKRQLQALDAFEQLWDSGCDCNLVLVGKLGWMADELQRRISSSRYLDQRLFWLQGISDEALLQLYETASCLIAASEDEGFGLPLIEAAQHGIPMIVRDIPVFREVAGNHAFYFKGSSANDLCNAVRSWLDLFRSGEHPESSDMPWLTWQDSAAMLIKKLLPPAASDNRANEKPDQTKHHHLHETDVPSLT